jgi:hypothetical protein
VTHDEIRELVPIYALDALEGDEERRVRDHLQSCPPCQAALETHRLAVGAFALVAEPVRPPDALRRRLMQAIGDSAQLEPAGVIAPATVPAPGAVRRDKTGSRPWLRWQRAAAVLGAAAVLALGVFSYSLSRRLAERDRVIAQENQFISRLSSPLLDTFPMIATGNAVKASGRVYIAADRRSGGFIATGLADPGKRVYQLWLITDGQPAPLAPFRPNADGLALVPIQGNLSSLPGMAVTLELHAGLRAPQGPMVLRSA